MVDFSIPPEYEADLQWARSLVDERVIPLESERLDFPFLSVALAPVQLLVKQRGLWALHMSEDLGGSGRGQLFLALLHEVLGRSVLAPLAFGCNAPDSGNQELLALAGLEQEQRQAWLDPLVNGETRSAYALTEPGAGADPTMISTTAVPADGGWRINGEKWFITNASIADIFLVVAVTDPEAARHSRTSVFVVEAGTAGLEVRRNIPTMEDPDPGPLDFNAHAAVSLTDVWVPGSHLIGGRGQGFALAQKRLGPGRIHHAMRWLGQSWRAYELLCSRAVQRQSHGSSLAEKQIVQKWVADSLAEITQARLLTLYAAWRMDQVGAKNAMTEISMIKYVGARSLHNVIDRAIQVNGSLGYSGDLPLESMYRAARAARLYDGPDEVHIVAVAKRELARFA